MKVIINLGRGNLARGCDNIVVQMLDRDGNCRRQFNGSLPPAPELARLHQQWQSGYRAFYQERAMRIGLLQSEGSRYSEADFRQMCRQLPLKLNDWLSSDRFASIERSLRTELNKNEAIQIIITTEDRQIEQLPWHSWNLVEDYPQATIVFSLPNWQKSDRLPVKKPKVRILVILGNSTGLDVTADLTSLASLPETELTILKEPALSVLNEHLWQPAGWDILLFSGHSYSDLEAGYIYLNDRENITIAQLKHSLQKAIALGLQIAIFNSCEGVGLAVQLADLSIPYTVVMGEPVPDKIAQVFLKYFLTAFTAGKTFTLAVKEARQKLAGWEIEYVCASWLPVIWQNPTVGCLRWQDLLPDTQPQSQQKPTKFTYLCGLAVSSLVMVMRSLSWLEPLELAAYDRLMQQRPPETIDPRIVVVEITEADTNRDRYPISDGVLVEAIELLNQERPAAIGVDIHRAYERGTQHQNLIELFATNSHIFPVCSYSSGNDSYAPPNGLTEAKLSQQMGFSDLLIDGRSTQVNSSRLDLATQDLSQIQSPKIRRQLLSYEPDLANSTSKCLTPYSLSFQLAFEYLQQAGVEPMQVNSQLQWQFGDVVFEELSSRFGPYQQLEDKSSQIMLNYRSGEPGKRITLAQLRSGVEPQLIENRIVLIGYSASVARDYFNTPYGTMPGVWIHAHQTSQLISAVRDGRSLIWALPQWGDWFFIFTWSLSWGTILIVLNERDFASNRQGLSLLRQKTPIYTLLTLGIFILLIDRICLIALIRGGWLPYVPTISSLLIMTVIVAIAHVVTSKEIKN
jgi:CHASE2 domain-containing sensor protein